MSKELQDMTKDELVDLVGGLQSQVTQMQFQLDQLNRLLFGAKRERFISSTDENQLSLPFEVEQEEDPDGVAIRFANVIICCHKRKTMIANGMNWQVGIPNTIGVAKFVVRFVVTKKATC